MYNRECFSSGPYGPAVSVFHSVALKALASLFLLTAFSIVALATVDATLNTTNFVSGQASELSLDGVIGQGGTSTSINGAALTIRFDPAKLTLSGIRSGPNGWGLTAYNTTYLSEGWAKVVLGNSSGAAGEGQTSTGPIMYFTVTPVDSSVDVNDCDTLQLSGAESDLSNQDYYTITPSDPCNGVYAPSGGAGPSTGSSPTTKGGGGTPMGPMSLSTDIDAIKRILQYAAGLAVEADRRTWPYTEDDAATMELTDTNFTMIASPPGACNIPTSRTITIFDAMVYIKIAFSYQPSAAWEMAFLGNPQLGGNAANSTGMPAIADIDGDTKLEAVFPMGMINGTNYYDPRYIGNPNQIYVLKDLNNNGTYGLKLGNANTPGFPQPMRDAPIGVTVANLLPPSSGADHPEIVASNFQDTFDINGHYLGDLYSRLYVWDSDGHGISPFAHSDNSDSTIGMALGHANSAPSAWDVDKNGKPEVFFPAIGQYNDTLKATRLGSIQRLEATRNGDGTVTVTTRAIQSSNADGRWLTVPDVTSGSHANFQSPPAMIRTSLNDVNSDRVVADASDAGDVYGWDKNGDPVFYFQTDDIIQTVNEEPKDRGRVAGANPIAAGDVTGDGKSDLIVPTGHYLNYAERNCEIDPPEIARWWDGFIYCYAPDTVGTWHPAWRYPSTLITDEYGRAGGYPAFASGVSIGRLRGNDINPLTEQVYPPCVVAVDSSGRVVALNGADGSELWTFDILWTPTSPPAPNNKSYHRYTRGCVTQPLILDINGDDYEDVIVGTTSGWVWFLNGHPSGSQGEQLPDHPPIHTLRSADSTTIDHVVEPQYEEVRGLAVGPLKSTPLNPTDGQTRSILMVTSGRAGLTYPPQVGGHAFLFDLGAGSWDPTAASWPQFQQNAQRTSHYPGP